MPYPVTGKISFRPIRDEDRAFLLLVYSSTRAEELAQVDWDPPRKETFLTMQFDAQHRYYQEQFPDAEYLIIEVAGRPIGRLYVHRRPDEIRLIDIALLPENRGGGIGTALLTDLLGEARRAGKPVRIHVERFNPALRLYERLGFVRVEEQGVYWLMEWRPGENPKSAGGVKREAASAIS